MRCLFRFLEQFHNVKHLRRHSSSRKAYQHGIDLSVTMSEQNYCKGAVTAIFYYTVSIY